MLQKFDFKIPLQKSFFMANKIADFSSGRNIIFLKWCESDKANRLFFGGRYLIQVYFLRYE
jgi:hypothetical protein